MTLMVPSHFYITKEKLKEKKHYSELGIGCYGDYIGRKVGGIGIF